MKALTDLIGSTGFKVPGLGVVVFKDGRELFSQFLGNRRLGSQPEAVTRKTRFRIASVSKMFTVFTILQLVECGRLSLDSDVGELLGFELRNPNQPHEKISVAMLASHTSSLRDGKIYSLPPSVSVSELFRPDGKFWENGAHFAPPEEKIGEFFTYSNLNYGLLGTIVEAVTGTRFDIYQRENLFRQLDIKADYLPANLSDEEFKQLGTLYRKKNSHGLWDEFGSWRAQIDDFTSGRPVKDTVALQNPYAENFQDVYSLQKYLFGTNATVFSPQGGLRISFDELANTLEMILNDGVFRGRKILSRQSLETMFRSYWKFNPLKPNGSTSDGIFSSYGLGSYRVDFSGRNFIGHGGEAFGMISGLFVDPSDKTGFAYMMNGQALDPDNDTRAKGSFGGLFIWEEKIWRALSAFL